MMVINIFIPEASIKAFSNSPIRLAALKSTQKIKSAVFIFCAESLSSVAMIILSAPFIHCRKSGKELGETIATFMFLDVKYSDKAKAAPIASPSGL